MSPAGGLRIGQTGGPPSGSSNTPMCRKPSRSYSAALRSLLASMYVGSPAESALSSVGCMSVDPTPCPCRAVRTADRSHVEVRLT